MHNKEVLVAKYTSYDFKLPNGCTVFIVHASQLCHGNEDSLDTCTLAIVDGANRKHSLITRKGMIATTTYEDLITRLKYLQSD